jgi:hypothetical protein
LGIAPITVMLHWRLARAWLQREMRSEAELVADERSK